MSQNSSPSGQLIQADETRISAPAPREAFPVSWSDWDFVKERIRKCEVVLDRWGYGASFFLSGAIFAFTLAVSASLGDESAAFVTAFYVVGGAALLLSGLSIIGRVNAGRTQHERIEGVMEDMEQIERRYERPDGE